MKTDTSRYNIGRDHLSKDNTLSGEIGRGRPGRAHAARARPQVSRNRNKLAVSRNPNNFGIAIIVW